MTLPSWRRYLAEIFSLFGKNRFLSFLYNFWMLSVYHVEESGVLSLGSLSIALWWNLLGKLGFDLASCRIGKEISALVGIFFLFHAILV
jgi:uncharacterized membrane protein